MRLRRGAAASACLAAPLAHAHGFGQRYDLPLPLELYASGAALTVVLSCVLFALFLRSAPAAAPAGRGRTPSRALVAVLRILAVLLYLLVLFAGFFGNPNPFRNIVPVFVWAIAWVGLAYVCALVGDVWKVANPIDTLFAPFERHSLKRPYPRALGWWPAVAVYFALLWMEIAWDASDSPRAIAAALLGYSVVTWMAMFVFGREAWLENGDALSKFFGTLARFSPIDVRLSGNRTVECVFRAYGAGLLTREPLDASAVAFVILVLAGVSFDGFLETGVWQELEASRTAGLVAAPLLFALVYLAFCALMARAAGLREPGAWRRVAGFLVLTLVPIAIAYEIAHYFSFLVQAGQYMVPLASDPFGRGWNLFGTANLFIRPAIVDSRIVWIVAMVAIVAGHVAAIYLGHLLAMREFPDRRAALHSEGPMLVLMVGYTMLSLWIVAQPIVSSR